MRGVCVVAQGGEAAIVGCDERLAAARHALGVVLAEALLDRLDEVLAVFLGHQHHVGLKTAEEGEVEEVEVGALRGLRDDDDIEARPFPLSTSVVRISDNSGGGEGCRGGGGGRGGRGGEGREGGGRDVMSWRVQ